MRDKSKAARSAAAGALVTFCVAAVVALGFTLPVAAASASEGVPEPPDGRVYEQVSPQQKNGNQAGVFLGEGEEAFAAYTQTSPNGERVAYGQNGPFGETSSGADFYSVSTRNAGSGWETSAALPPEQLSNGDILGKKALSLLGSEDLSRFVFSAFGPFVKENGTTSEDSDLGLLRTRGNSSEPEWLTRPLFTSLSEAKPEPGSIDLNGVAPAGGSPDLSTVYFTYYCTLVPADEARAAFVEPVLWNEAATYTEGELVEEGKHRYKSLKGENKGHKPSELGEWWETSGEEGATGGPWGFYEFKEGELSSAGVLPADSPYPGEPDPYGAVPAVALNSTSVTYPFPGPLLHQVSEDGSKAFFVSPEPRYATQAGTPTELYVREQTNAGPRTVLVSRNEENGGAPAEGSGANTAVTPVKTVWASKAYVYAAPDGSRAFFESHDKLAKSAAGAEPEGSGPWTYEFNLETEKLTYLPGVLGPIAASSQDGSTFIFEDTVAHEIELWTGGPAPVEVATFSAPGEPKLEGAAAKDGAVFVFDTNAVLARGAQTFDNSEAGEQAYRYDLTSQTLSCVSCSPAGEAQSPVEAGVRNARARGIAGEGARVFFSTAAKLLAGDTGGAANVYEWEQPGVGSCASEEREGGCLYLISTGTSSAPSFYLDGDESGDNVFFATRQGLVKGDTDESFDLYDARVNGGFPEAAPPGECDESCRQTAGAPQLSSPLTSSIGPSGNLAPAKPTVPSAPRPMPLTRAQKLARALQACAKLPKRKRATCVKRARARYGAKAKSKKKGKRSARSHRQRNSGRRS